MLPSFAPYAVAEIIKKLIYRANAPPPADAVRVGSVLQPIQEAQPIRGGSITFKMFVGKTQKDNKKKVVVGESPQDVSAAMNVVRAAELRKRIEESDQLTNVLEPRDYVRRMMMTTQRNVVCLVTEEFDLVRLPTQDGTSKLWW